MSEAAEHACGRVSRYLICATADENPPKFPYAARPDGAVVVGDGRAPADLAEARAAALTLRADCDSRGGLWWVWVGHDNFFYSTEWQFFLCFGPPDWESEKGRASRESGERLARLHAAKHAADREDGKRRAEAARLARIAAGPGRKKKGRVRNLDAIVEAGGADGAGE